MVVKGYPFQKGFDCMKKFYLAYGSNLNVKQMQFRCSDARIVGTAEIPNYQLLFKGSKTGSYLTIEPKQGCTVPAAVWSVSERDELALDRYEGYPHFYYKTELELPLAETGKKLTAFVYIMHEENGTTFEEIDSIDFTEKEIDDDALFDEEYENACEFEWECMTGR